MARKRVIYQSEALFVGSTGNGTALTSPTELNRVQSANYSFEVTRTDVNEFGVLARIDSIIVEQPTVSLDFSYFQTTGNNEIALGLSLGTVASPVAALSGILAGVGEDVKNYYIYVSPEGSDAQGYAGAATPKCIGIGNGFLSSFSAEASVGDIPTTTVNAEALNMRFFTDVTAQANPGVNPVDGTNASGTFTLSVPDGNSGISALRPGDITFTLDNSAVQGATASDLKIQSFSLSFDLSREPLEKLGSKFAFSREIEFPVTATMSVEAVLGDLEADNLASIVANDSTVYTLSARINRPGTSTMAIQYEIRGAKLDSQDFSSSIGDNKTVSLSFSTQINGPEDVTNGVFIHKA